MTTEPKLIVQTIAAFGVELDGVFITLDTLYEIYDDDGFGAPKEYGPALRDALGRAGLATVDPLNRVIKTDALLPFINELERQRDEDFAS
jgi:hypothetical protein